MPSSSAPRARPTSARSARSWRPWPSDGCCSTRRRSPTTSRSPTSSSPRSTVGWSAAAPCTCSGRTSVRCAPWPSTPRCSAPASARPCSSGSSQRARLLGLSRLFCLTFETAFFTRHGFEPIEGQAVDPEVYAELLRSYDEGVAEFLDLERVKPNTLGNTRMLRVLSRAQPRSSDAVTGSPASVREGRPAQRRRARRGAASSLRRRRGVRRRDAPEPAEHGAGDEQDAGAAAPARPAGPCRPGRSPRPRAAARLVVAPVVEQRRRPRPPGPRTPSTVAPSALTGSRSCAGGPLGRAHRGHRGGGLRQRGGQRGVLLVLLRLLVRLAHGSGHLDAGARRRHPAPPSRPRRGPPPSRAPRRPARSPRRSWRRAGPRGAARRRRPRRPSA